jgi:hypothetical protein
VTKKTKNPLLSHPFIACFATFAITLGSPASPIRSKGVQIARSPSDLYEEIAAP